MADITPAGAATWSARRVRVSGSSVVLVLVALVAVQLGRGVVDAASQPLGWLAAAATTALVLAPVVELPARWVPRVVAILLTLVLGSVVVATLGAGLFVQVQDQLDQLADDLPAAAAELEEGTGTDGVLAELEFTSLVQQLVDQTSERVSPDPSVEDAAGTVPAYFVSGVLVIFLLVWARRLADGFLGQIADDDRRDRLERVGTVAIGLTQRYVLASLASAVAVAVIGGGLAWALGLPTPLVLGVVLGIASLVPYLGVVVGSLPVLVLSAALEPATTTLAVAAALVVLQAGHTVVTRRTTEAIALRVGPAVLVIAALVGSDLYGIGGALVAVVAGVAVVATVEARRRDLGDQETETTTVRA